MLEYEVLVIVIATTGADALAVEQVPNSNRDLDGEPGSIPIDDRLMIKTIPLSMVPQDHRLANSHLILTMTDRYTVKSARGA